MYPSNEEETIFPDGTVQKASASGELVLSFPNGQQEVHTSLFKKRTYPDGTVKIVFNDGRQETRFADGRVRIKDRNGTVLIDQ
jgi:centromere protein J